MRNPNPLSKNHDKITKFAVDGYQKCFVAQVFTYTVPRKIALQKILYFPNVFVFKSVQKQK